MKRKRAEWKVRLRKSNYEQTKGQLVPQVIVTRKYTLDDVIGRIMAVGNCAVNREVLEYAASLLTRHIGDCLLEGASVSTPLGQLTPVVTGTWQAADRKDPEVRALNTATVRYSISPELRHLLDDPLLEAVGVGVQNALAIYSLKDVGSQTVNERLTPGRKLILGGVLIPYEKGLLGHSDADVLSHAISDALLGALALGDIGKWFPDTDERYKGADSLVLLRHVVDMLAERGWQVGNIDATILAQRPKLRDYIDTMRENLARVCGVLPDQVSVKATTEEGLGFTGKGDGIAAHAVCLLTRQQDQN